MTVKEDCTSRSTVEWMTFNVFDLIPEHNVQLLKIKYFLHAIMTEYDTFFCVLWSCVTERVCFGGGITRLHPLARLISPAAAPRQPQPIPHLHTALPFACGPGRDN